MIWKRGVLLRLVVVASLMGMVFGGSGCGQSSDAPTVYPVTGTLKKGGEPLKNVTVTFVPVDSGQSAVGNTGDDGSFELTTANVGPGAIAGSYKVVLSMAATTDESKYTDSGEGEKPPEDPTKAGLPFPEEYTSPDTSPKSVEVKQQSNQIDIDI